MHRLSGCRRRGGSGTFPSVRERTSNVSSRIRAGGVVTSKVRLERRLNEAQHALLEASELGRIGLPHRKAARGKAKGRSGIAAGCSASRSDGTSEARTVSGRSSQGRRQPRRGPGRR
jgi:hypothetical protein